jgi:hypothetical protein
VGEQVGGCVERGDRQGDADRGAVGEGGVADTAGPAGHRKHLAARAPGLGRRDGEGVGDPVDLAAAVLDRLAEFEGEQAGQVVAAAQRLGGGPVEDLRAGRG